MNTHMYNRTSSGKKAAKPLPLLLRGVGASIFLLLLSFGNAFAQAPTISYPTAAQNLSRGIGDSLLTVKLVFNGVCTGTVRISLPASVTYVAGTVTKTSGTAAVSIAESSIADLSKPTFSISGIAAIGDEITFTVARRAGCGSLATAKDSVYFVAGAGCSDGSEIAGTVNTYNLFAPTLPITPAAALTGAFVGSTYSRTTVVTNGGNGPTDTVRFYIVYPAAGIANSSGTNVVTANGVSFTPSSTNGDTLFYKFAGATLFGGNNLLTSGETVTVVEPIRVLKCNTTTTYGACWGRSDAELCEKPTATSSMTMAVGVANLTNSFTQITQAGSCTDGVYDLVYTNTGSGGLAGAAYNVTTYLGQEYFLSAAATNAIRQNIGFHLINFKVNGNPVTVTWDGVVGGAGDHAYVFNTSQFTADPDGVGVGLDDLDGDGFYDDLPVGAVLTLRFEADYQCSSACGYATSITQFNAVALFNTMCGTNVRTTIGSSPFGFSDYQLSSVIKTVPTDVANGVPFNIKLSHEWSWSGFNCSPSNKHSLNLILPAGLAYSGNATVSGVSVTPTTSGSTLSITGPFNGNNNWAADLVFTCGTAGVIKIPYTISLECELGGCCVKNLICDTLVINAHCPCAATTGMINMTAGLKRSTLGWTDNTMTTKVSASSLPAENLKISMPCDTMDFSATSSHLGTHNNLFLEYTHGTIGGGVSPINFLAGSGNLYLRDASSGTVYNCIAPNPTYSYVSGTALYSWDFTPLIGTCLPSGFVLDAGDSVSYTGKFVVACVTDATTSSVIPNAIVQIPSTNSYFYNLVGATREYCDNYGTEQYLVNDYSWTASPDVINNTGCATYVNTLLLRSNPAIAGDLFPAEFRPAHIWDSLVVNVGSLDEYDPTFSTYLQITNGTGTGFPGGLTTFSIGDPTITGNKLVWVNPGTWPVADWVRSPSNYEQNVIRFRMRTNCSSANGNLVWTAYFKDRQWSTPFQRSLPYTQPVNNSGKSSISIQNNTGTVQGVGVQQYWDVQINNPSVSTAPYIWMALEKGSSSIVVDSVVLKPSNVVLSPISYGVGNNWYQVSTAGIASGANQQARVYFKYSSCSLDSINMKSGWNCYAYPSSPSTYTCSISNQYLKIDPQPSQVQLSVLRQPGGGSSIDLCTVDSTLLVLNSAQAANLVNPYVTFFPPAGLTLVTPIQVEYPRGSGDYQNTTVTSLPGGGYQINLNAHTAIGTSGMFGTANASPSFVPLGGDREAKIKVNFTTDCSYISGTSFTFNAYGNRPCGAPAIDNGIAATTSKLDITGASAAGGAGVTISFGGGATTVGCGSTAVTLSLITTPTSLGTTAGDTMTYTLPAGMGYAGNLTAGYTAVVTGGGGAPTIVKIAMPTGVAPSTPINFNFDVTPQGGGCGAVNITGAYQRRIASLMCGAVTCASSSVVISSATSPNITLVKPSLSISNVTLSGATAWVQANYYANRVKVYYNNTGTQALTANVDTVEFFCGSSTVPFAKMQLTKNVAIGASDSDTYDIMMPIGSCSLGDVVTAKIQTITAAGAAQCLCAGASYLMAGFGLPLEFLSATATAKDCAVTIDWTYNKSSEIAKFAIERSIDGSQYATVASLKANAASYVDVTPNAGTWLYRIKAIGVNGAAKYSSTEGKHQPMCG